MGDVSLRLGVAAYEVHLLALGKSVTVEGVAIGVVVRGKGSDIGLLLGSELALKRDAGGRGEEGDGEGHVYGYSY